MFHLMDRSGLKACRLFLGGSHLLRCQLAGNFRAVFAGFFVPIVGGKQEPFVGFCEVLFDARPMEIKKPKG